MVENRRLIDALVARAEAEGIDLRATAVSTYDSRPDGVTVTLADGNVIEASLLVAADGARQNCASAPALPPMAGTTINPASSSPSAMSGIITAAPKSIFSRRVRSRSCR